MTPAKPVSFETANGWTGLWRWNKETAKFSNPHHADIWDEQAHHITSENGKITFHAFQLYLDGSRRSWTWDGMLDGKPRPILWDDDGTVFTDIAFFMLTEDMGGDAYRAEGGEFRGAEHFVLKPDHVAVWGCSTTETGEMFPYFEEWHRLDPDNEEDMAFYRNVTGESA